MSEHFVVVNKAGEVVPQSLVTADELARLCATLSATNYVDAPFRVVRTYTQAELDAAVAAEREARADRRRLDWLADPANHVAHVMLPRAIVGRNIHSLRDAIDEAMELKEIKQ